MVERMISEKFLQNLKRFNQKQSNSTRIYRDFSAPIVGEKDLKKITISELVERTGVSRADFYRNYGSKEEILKFIF